MPQVALAVPSLALLPGFFDAVRRGWSRTNVDMERIAQEDLVAIERDPAAFVASLDDPDARGAPIRLPDGSIVPRLPGFNRWITDGEFCRSVSMRWQSGTGELRPYVLGHIGFTIVPWKRRRGYATEALGLLLRDALALGLPYVELTTDPDNVASQKVILANGGQLLGQFRKVEAYGGVEGLRYRIPLASARHGPRPPDLSSAG